MRYYIRCLLLSCTLFLWLFYFISFVCVRFFLFMSATFLFFSWITAWAELLLAYRTICDRIEFEAQSSANKKKNMRSAKENQTVCVCARAWMVNPLCLSVFFFRYLSPALFLSLSFAFSFLSQVENKTKKKSEKKYPKRLMGKSAQKSYGELLKCDICISRHFWFGHKQLPMPWQYNKG